MYECCNVKRFLRLLVLDAIIFSLCFIFLFIGKNIAFSAENDEKGNSCVLTAVIFESSPTTYLENSIALLKANEFSFLTADERCEFPADNISVADKAILIVNESGDEELRLLLEKHGITAVSITDLPLIEEKYNVTINEIPLEEFLHSI